MISSLQLITLASFLVGNFAGFRITLWLLKVKDDVNRRSLILTGYFLFVQFLSGTIAYLIGLTQLAALVMAIVMFSVVLKRFLVLKLWQLVVIPVGVSLLSSVVLGVSVGILITLFGPMTLG